MEEYANKMKYLKILGPLILIVMLLGITYAFFNYTRTGTRNTIKVGRISFVTRELDTINLTNVFPIASSEATGENPNYDEVVIEIVGDTDYTGGIEYLISAVDANIYTTEGQLVPISLDVRIDDDLGTENNNYFVSRENTNTSIYKKIVGDTLVGDGMLLVGYIAPNTTGNIDGIDATITIKAYLDKDKIKISDTYDGTESDNMGTLNSIATGKTVLTTAEWNALQSSSLSFKVKIEANEGIWVKEIRTLYGIMRENAVMDNINSTYVNNETPGIDFGAISSDTNGKGVYTRVGTENQTYPIYYYRGAVEDNNVVFGGYCWQAVRTTDTGGVKLIYNGESSAVYEEVTLDDSNYTIDTVNTDSRWTYDSNDKTWNISIEDNSQPAMEFTLPAGNDYGLVVTGTSGTTCGGSFVIYENGSSVNGVSSGGGLAFNLTHNFGTLATTDVIKVNYMGNSSSTCEITFKFKITGSGEKISDICNNSREDTIIELNGDDHFAFNTYSNSLAYNGYMYGAVYEYSTANWTNGAYFGSSFTWDGTNYKLVDASVTTPDSTHHYSCNMVDANETCSNLRYVYYVSGSTKYYITLTGGDGIEDAIEKMQTNTNDSNVKEKIDTWYASNLTSYTNKLEDTIWCNDRSFGNENNNGWIASGGDLSTILYYGVHERSNYAHNTSAVKNNLSLMCNNKNDRFTVNSNKGNGSLTYPVGMLTADEVALVGGLGGEDNRTFYLYNEDDYWILSPSCYNDSNAFGFTVYTRLDDDSTVTYTKGLRPAISIKPGLPIVKGDGTINNPYVIE